MKALILFLLLLQVSCGKRSKLVFEAPPEEVDFTLLSSSLIENKCVGCHKGFADEERLSRFIQGNDPDQSRLYLAVKEGKMPPKGPPLNSEELELIRNYISHLTVKPEANIPADKVDFKVLSDVVLDKCITCHKSWTAEEKFAKHIKGNDPDQSRFYLSVVEGKMPKNGPKFSEKELEVIRNYIRNLKPKPVL